MAKGLEEWDTIASTHETSLKNMTPFLMAHQVETCK
jgi:hypothetical protein